MDYIAIELNNPQAADDFVTKIEEAIIERLDCPKAFESYHSSRDRENVYYRIYVGKFIVYYVVIDEFMEVRRIIYNKRNIKKQI